MQDVAVVCVPVHGDCEFLRLLREDGACLVQEGPQLLGSLGPVLGDVEHALLGGGELVNGLDRDLRHLLVQAAQETPEFVHVSDSDGPIDGQVLPHGCRESAAGERVWDERNLDAGGACSAHGPGDLVVHGRQGRVVCSHRAGDHVLAIGEHGAFGTACQSREWSAGDARLPQLTEHDRRNVHALRVGTPPRQPETPTVGQTGHSLC